MDIYTQLSLVARQPIVLDAKTDTKDHISKLCNPSPNMPKYGGICSSRKPIK